MLAAHRIRRPCDHAVGGRARHSRGMLLEPDNVPLLSFCALVAAVCRLHPSRQHCPHARGSRESRSATMAVSIANRLGDRLLNRPMLLVLLADGRLHSGEWLAKELGVSRAAVWKGVERCAPGTWKCRRCRGAGTVCRARSNCWMHGASAPNLDAHRRPQLRKLELLFEVDSTNSATAWPQCRRRRGSADVCLERVAARRPRAARPALDRAVRLPASRCRWRGPSAMRRTRLVGSESGSRGRRRARGCRVPDCGWCNAQMAERHLFQDRKIGGVLIELRAEAGGPAHVVIGVGINVAAARGGAPRNRGRRSARRGGRSDACPSHPRAIWWRGPSWTNF